MPACLCRFSDWVMSTSPYTGQKTPPTVSMMSVRADENTPPHLQDAAAAGEACMLCQSYQCLVYSCVSCWCWPCWCWPCMIDCPILLAGFQACFTHLSCRVLWRQAALSGMAARHQQQQLHTSAQPWSSNTSSSASAHSCRHPHER